MKRLFALALGLGLVAAMAVPALAADRVQNGGFENGTYVGTPSNPDLAWVGYRLTTGGIPADSINGWVVSLAGGVDWISKNFWQPGAGDFSIDLNGEEKGRISQSFSTTPYAHYVVTWLMAGNPNDNLTGNNCDIDRLKTMTVDATNGGAPQTFSFSTSGKSYTDMGWTDDGYMYSFDAGTAGSTTISFTSTVAGKCGPALDRIVIMETLPAADKCKKGGWENMTDSVGNPFKNQGDCVSFYATGEKNLAFTKDDE